MLSQIMVPGTDPALVDWRPIRNHTNLKQVIFSHNIANGTASTHSPNVYIARTPTPLKMN